jgi:alanine dehydrogenase
MKIGVPKEVKIHEYRVAITPPAVLELTRRGHAVYVEMAAGEGAGIHDTEYATAGATILPDAPEVFASADMIVKVKEPQHQERALLRREQILFTFLHLAPDPQQTSDLLASGATCIAYETVTSPLGALPLLAPMSEVAGRLAPQVGSAALLSGSGGRGILLGGVPGVLPGDVLIIGGGVSGTHAATIALGLGARVTLLDRSQDALKRIAAQFGGQVRTLYSTEQALEDLLPMSDLVIATVLVPGAAAPKLIRRSMLKSMKPGAVIVDVAIDQGGCSETSRPTTHAHPTYVVDDVVHYCVANMPGAVPRTSTYALCNATLPHVLALADKGWRKACTDDPHLLAGLNIHDGMVTCGPVAEAQGLEHVTSAMLVAAE